MNNHRMTSTLQLTLTGNPAIRPIGMPPMSNSLQRWWRNNVLALAGDDHRDTGRVCHGGADRAEQHSGESAPAVAADHDELGGLGFVEQMASGVVEHQPAVNGDIGIAFLPAGQAFGKDFGCPGLQGRPLLARARPRRLLSRSRRAGPAGPRRGKRPRRRRSRWPAPMPASRQCRPAPVTARVPAGSGPRRGSPRPGSGRDGSIRC